jgi:hypothetical protein
MKNIYIVLLIVVVGICLHIGYVFKDSSCFKSSGVLRIGEGVVPGLSHNGSAFFEGTTFTGPIHINGSLDARSASFKSLDIKGNALLYDCIFKLQVVISGSIKAYNCRFNEMMFINSKNMQFDSCKIDELQIEKNAGDNDVQTLVLQHGSKVTGPVTFESNNGEIIIDATSECGMVFGGKTIHR